MIHGSSIISILQVITLLMPLLTRSSGLFKFQKICSLNSYLLWNICSTNNLAQLKARSCVMKAKSKEIAGSKNLGALTFKALSLTSYLLWMMERAILFLQAVISWTLLCTTQIWKKTWIIAWFLSSAITSPPLPTSMCSEQYSYTATTPYTTSLMAKLVLMAITSTSILLPQTSLHLKKKTTALQLHYSSLLFSLSCLSSEEVSIATNAFKTKRFNKSYKRLLTSALFETY